MYSRLSSPCALCGAPTHLLVTKASSSGNHRAVPLCAECITLWNSRPSSRALLLASRRSWGGEEVRLLARGESRRNA